MEVTSKLRQRFCKDCKLPITVFDEPYFTERINLYDTFYDSVNLWDRFIQNVIDCGEYPTIKDYDRHYNQVKDSAIEFIKSTKKYLEFNSIDMNNYAVPVEYRYLPKKDIYTVANDGKMFLSIDMIKANYSSLHYFDSSIFDNSYSWKGFLSKFTDNEHILQSKQIRQVILGNCNPSRQLTYEKYLMSKFIQIIQANTDLFDNIVFFSNDEIVLDITDLDNSTVANITYILRSLFYKYTDKYLSSLVKLEIFTLHKIKDASGFYKKISNPTSIEIVFKCVESYFLPFVIRRMKGETIQESDKVFMFEGHLVKFLD